MIGGTLAATVIAIFFIPMFYWVLETWSAKLFGKKRGRAKPPAALEAPCRSAGEQH